MSLKSIGFPRRKPGKPREKSKVPTRRYLLGLLFIACQFVVLYELCVLAGFSYWLIIILFLFAYNLRYYKDLFEWMNGKPVKIFDDVLSISPTNQYLSPNTVYRNTSDNCCNSYNHSPHLIIAFCLSYVIATRI